MFIHLFITMVMFQDLISWMSLIRHCQDNRLFMSTNMFCHITCSFCRFPSSLRKMKWRWALMKLEFAPLHYAREIFHSLTRPRCSPHPCSWGKWGSRLTAQLTRCLYRSAPSTWRAVSCSTERIHLHGAPWSGGRWKEWFNYHLGGGFVVF